MIGIVKLLGFREVAIVAIVAQRRLWLGLN